jgi:hypothetical protein
MAREEGHVSLCPACSAQVTSDLPFLPAYFERSSEVIGRYDGTVESEVG